MTTPQHPQHHSRPVRHLWHRYGWLIIALLWTAALILGYVGFSDNAKSAGKPSTPLDIAYRVLQLVSMGSGDPSSGEMTWALDAARFLIPLLAAWTAIRALLSVFGDRWQHFRLRFWHDHVIVCGLSRKGWLLAQGFASRGGRVLVVEVDEAHSLIGPCRERGILVLVGDATDAAVLRRAGVRRARHLVAVTDDDGVNAEIAVCSQGLLQVTHRRRSYPLTCTVHVVDPQLYALARARELALEERVPLRLELFNVFDQGARLLWSQYGPAMGAVADTQPPGRGPTSPCSAHVLVVGLGRLGESLAVCAARDWHTRIHDAPCRAAGRLRITVVDLEADWKCQALTLRYPQLAGVCDLVPLTIASAGPSSTMPPSLPAALISRL